MVHALQQQCFYSSRAYKPTIMKYLMHTCKNQQTNCSPKQCEINVTKCAVHRVLHGITHRT